MCIIGNELTNLKADKIKNEELAQKYINVKNFLQKIAPKDFVEQRRVDLEAKIEEIKTQWMDRELMLKDGNYDFGCCIYN